MSVRRWLTDLLGFGYRDTFTVAGTPNFHPFPVAGDSIPGMYRTGLPPSEAAWEELRRRVERVDRPVVRVVLHDDAEGDESPAVAFGWSVLRFPMPPEDDRPLSIFVRPTQTVVDAAVEAIVAARARRDTVVWGCVHGRDRTGLVSALVGRRLIGWTKKRAWDYAVQTGLRWELPDIDAYWAEEVPDAR